MSPALSAALSALQQAGVASTEFHRSNLSVRELQNASLARIHTLQAEALSGLFSPAGIELPMKVGQTSGRDPVVMCLRPGEWLVCSALLPAGELLELLSVSGPASQLADHTATLDVSDGLAVFQLAGEGAPWLLAKLSGLDFIGGRNLGQHCARTRLGQVAVVVNYHPRGDGSSDFASDYVWDLIFDRSIARYVWELLQHSADHAEELGPKNWGRRVGAENC